MWTILEKTRACGNVRVLETRFGNPRSRRGSHGNLGRRSCLQSGVCRVKDSFTLAGLITLIESSKSSRNKEVHT